MEKIKLLIDNKPYTSKPDSKETGGIKTRLANAEALKEYTLNVIVECIGKGYTITPAVLENGTKNENWVQQQLFCLDIDNEAEGEISTPEKTIHLLDDIGIKPFAYYHTFNSSEVKPKYRLLFLLEKPTDNQEEAKFIIKTLIDFIPQADKACKDLSRLFYGTNKEVKIIDPEARITLEDVIKFAKPEAESKTEDNTDYEVSSNLKQLTKEFDLEKYMIQDGNEVCGSSGSWTYFKTCKICGHKDCLRYHKDNNTFYCFGANGCKGGNIIKYLMITKNQDREEAIKYFKYTLLGIDPVTDLKQFHLELVKKQLKEISLSCDFIEKLDWVYYQVPKSKGSKKTQNEVKEEEYGKEDRS